MKPSLNKLRNIFKTEIDRGYDNRAVIGGIERLLERWEGEARQEALPEELIQAVAARLRDYARLAPGSRAEALEGLWKRIQRIEGAGVSPLDFGRNRPEAGGPYERPEQVGRPEQAGRRPESEPQGGADSQAGPKKTSQPAQQKGHQQKSGGKPSGAKGGNKPPAPARPAGRPAFLDGDAQDAEYAEQGEEINFAGEVLPFEANNPAVTPSAPAASGAEPPLEPAALYAPARVLKGVGPATSKVLETVGISTLRDILYYFPRRYDDYSQLKPINRLWYGDVATVIGTVQSVSTRPIKGNRQVVEAVVGDGTGAVRVSWFNQPFKARRLYKGAHVVLSGKVDQYLGRLVMNNPEQEFLDQEQLSTNRIVPVYPLTEGLRQSWLRRTISQVVGYWAPRVPDPLPSDLRRAAGLVDLSTALQQVHFPSSQNSLQAARQRLAFDEIFLLQLGVLRQKRAWQERPASVCQVDDAWMEDQLQRLPFALTNAQQRAVGDLRKDLASGRPMNRLLQGDVGSGKTVVAALAIAIVARSGGQSALMAPTSILAEQHARNLLKVLAGVGQVEAASWKGEPPATPPAAGEPPANLADEAAGSEAQAPIESRGDTAGDPGDESPGIGDESPGIGDEARGFGDEARGFGEDAPSIGEDAPEPEAQAQIESRGDLSPGIGDESPGAAGDDQPEVQFNQVIDYPTIGLPDYPTIGLPDALLKPEEIRLLVGATSEAEKREIRAGLADGSIKLVIGTHALIEDPVIFDQLELAIVDEQHRFGVEQRAALRSKGENPHLLVMTATPIPRSLALTLYGDLDLSVMDEAPPGRQPVATYVITPRERERAYYLIRHQVEQGRQAFIIYPLVEESSKSEARAAVEEHARLQRDIFPNFRLGLLHGRMRPEDKDTVMAEFRDQQTQVLVSTSVVEVGVDVPNATVMLIDGADHFGLAQLHQLRGRVGRGAEKSFCLLIPNSAEDAENDRLQAMVGTNDGFILAQKDLDLRGPGQFLGTRQSGFAELQMASLSDLKLIEKARNLAQTLFEKDPEINQPEHQRLLAALEKFWEASRRGDVS